MTPHACEHYASTSGTQADAIRFIDYVVSKSSFRSHAVRTDRGHELQALFHWHVADRGMQQVYIEPRSPQLNGKVERSHRTDKDEFYQLLVTAAMSTRAASSRNGRASTT